MQTTVKKSVTVSGININGTCLTKAVFEPAAENSGIVFVRDDLPGSPTVRCSSENAVVDSRWTSLVEQGVRIEHTEHILAAVKGLGITNLIIRLNGSSVPVVDGYSCRDFVTALQNAGILYQQAPRSYLTVKAPVIVADEFYCLGRRYDKYIAALPAENLELIYILDYPDRSLPVQIADFILDPETFRVQLADARSYITQEEYQQVAPLIGQGIDSVLVFSEGRAQGLRWFNEPARHKLVDLLGDLSTVGCDIKGKFIGFRSGHKLNIEMIKILSGCEDDGND